MIGIRVVARLTSAVAIAAAGAATYGLACGPFVTIMRPVETVRPGRVDAYVRGDVGVVREHFARRYLVQAFRRFNGLPAMDVTPSSSSATGIAVADAVKAWGAFRKTVTGDDVPSYFDTERDLGNYGSIPNCLRDTFAKAIETGRARADRYGLTSAQMREWVKAEDAVLANCSGGLTLPDPAAAGADPLARADRAYQTAAAYFYAERYDEAAKRFRDIAADAASPWHPYGRYLAGRARLRQATLAEPLDAAQLHSAETEFRATLADPAAASLHTSAAGLIEFIAYRTDRERLLRELSSTLGSAGRATPEQVASYERILDGLLDDNVAYDYEGIKDREAIVRSGELSDWVLVMQGTGGGATDRAVAQWKRTGRGAWLVAALWKAPADHPDATALLDAASKVAAGSPAYLTTAFLRVRLLAERGAAAQARALLATLPRTARTDDDTEAINLLNAERLMLAQSMDELLDAAPRYAVSARLDATPWQDPDDEPEPGPLARERVFDDDAAIVFSWRLPLARLTDAATSTRLPPRLRLRVAAAAFTRAWMLDRVDAALKVAPVLRALSPSAAADVQRFEAAVPADRHVAGLRLLLRTPGLYADVTGVEDDQDYGEKELSRTFDHLFRRNWWCGISPAGVREWPVDDAPLRVALYRSAGAPQPLFLSADERAAATREQQARAKIGSAASYLADEAVAWAKSRPRDPDAAEALAHAVEGTRWARCGSATEASRTAFQTLHRLFPNSEWARQTKYWY